MNLSMELSSVCDEEVGSTSGTVGRTSGRNDHHLSSDTVEELFADGSGEAGRSSAIEVSQEAAQSNVTARAAIRQIRPSTIRNSPRQKFAKTRGADYGHGSIALARLVCQIDLLTSPLPTFSWLAA